MADQRRDLINGARPKKSNVSKLANGPKAGKKGKKDGQLIFLINFECISPPLESSL